MNYIDIGRKAKVQYPEYADLSDYEAGRAYARTYLKDDLPAIDTTPEWTPEQSQRVPVTIDILKELPPPVLPTPPISVKTDAHVFLEWRVSHIGNQIAHINAQYAKDYAIRQAEFDHSIADERITQKYYLEKAQYALVILNSRMLAQDLVLTQQIGEEAAKLGYDRITYLAFRMRQIDTDEQLRLRGQQLKQDQQHKEEMARIERENAVKTTADKIAAATQAKLGRLQQERAIDEALDKALREAHEIGLGNDPPELKERRLAAKQQTIVSLEGQLNELRGLSGKDDFGSDAG